jgi:hypothetical protein
MNRMKLRAIGLLAIALAGMVGTQIAAVQSNLFLAAEIGCSNETGKIVLGVTGLVTSVGVEAAAIILCVNPWLGLGVAVAYGA